MTLSLSLEVKIWPMRETFVISRGAQDEVECILATLVDENGNRGRGEACGVTYAGETIESMFAQIEGIRTRLELGTSREELIEALPPGGARNAIDSALWDLEAKQSGRSVFSRAGLQQPVSVVTAYTIGIRSLSGYQQAAEVRSNYPLLKVKVNSDDPIEAVAAVHRGAPRARLIVDPNQSWSVETLKRVAPELSELGVVLLEQPVRVGDEEDLTDYNCPIPLCADELINDASDLQKAVGRFNVVSIKLDKAGGLTAALRLAQEARALGFQLMVGCMCGSSLAMAPALVVAQQCKYVDLDGPLLNEDWPDGLTYRDGVIDLPSQEFWG
jgi:L-alanine-DL-glutamate epimerase-like enolase superfamily enzyme